MTEQEHDSLQHLSGSAEEVEQISRHSNELLKPQRHSSNIPHSEIARSADFRSNFSIKERLANWFLTCFKCGNSEASFVNTLQDVERRHPASISQQLKRLIANSILKLKICQTSRLQLDANVMHPFVKVHIVNKNTGCYLQNLERTEDVLVYHLEELTIYKNTEKKYMSTENDIILPFATACCDFRKLGNSKGVWNQKFYVNYPAHLLLTPDTLFLFEILDFNHQALLYRNDQEKYDKHNMFRVAWSYLRPVGMAKTHLGKIQLQLYTYKYSQQSDEPQSRKSFIPDVYYDFLWNNHQKYQGYLEVQLNYCPKPKNRYVREGQLPLTVFDEQEWDRVYLDKYKDQNNQQQGKQEQKNSKDLYKFFRNRDICQIPKQLIYKEESQVLGCYRVKFIGNFLMAACSKKKITIIKVFNLANGEHIMSLKGHRGVIYKIESTINQTLMVTAGSDHIARIYSVPEYTGEFIDQDQSEDKIIADCMHTAAVYSVSLIHQHLTKVLSILTCCFDGYLRVWQCRIQEKTSQIVDEKLINDYTRAPKKVYPTASAVTEGNSFIVGDSIGQIRIFQLKKDKLESMRLIAHQQLKNDMILNIQILTKSHIIIQASDNIIRHFDLVNNKLRVSQTYTGAVFEKELVQCAVSPDNKYVLSPSEAGKPMLWDMFTGTQIPLDHLNLNVKGHLVCCDWHPRYNLVAISGFFQFCPVFVYGNILTESQIKLVSAQSTS